MADKFQLRINVTVEGMREDPRRPEYLYPDGLNRLEVSESMLLPAAGFMEVAAILARFHDLAESLRADPRA